MRAQAWLDRLDAITPALIEAAVRGAVVLLVALVVSHLLRRRSAAARHLVWVGAIAVQLALPLFAVWGPKWNVAVPRSVASVLPMPPAPASGPPAAASPLAAPLAVTPSRGATAPQADAPAQTREVRPSPSVTGSVGAASGRPSLPAQQSPAITGRTLLLLLWLAGAAFILLRLAVGTTFVAALARRGARVEDGSWLSLAQRLSGTLQIDRPLTLLRGSRVGVPITWGIIYPVVLLPDDADAWPEERRRFVLVHEMAHVKRLDALTQLAGQLALALFWFNPLVWIANRRMQLEREHACDDYVLRHGTPASHYAEELLTMVRSLGTPGRGAAQPAFAALAMARRSEFEGRMLSILDPVLDRHPLSKGRTLMSAFAALLLVVPLAALHPYERPASAAEAPLAAARDASVPTFTVHLPAGADSALPESFRIDFRGSDAAPALGRQSVPSLPSQPSEPSLPSTAASPSSPRSPMSPTSPTSPLSPVSGGGAYEALGAGLAKTADELRQVAAQAKSRMKPGSCSDRVTPGTVIRATSSHEGDDGLTSVRFLSLVEGGDCSEATVVGRVKFTDAEDDVADMPLAAYTEFGERKRGGSTRELVVRRADDGSIAHIYRVDGKAAPYDDDARRWFAGFLPVVLREASINTPERVARVRSQGGVDAVLALIARINSSGSKRAHYEALIAQGRLSGDDFDQVVRHAGRNIPSSGDLRSVLTKAAPSLRGGVRSGSAIEQAVLAVPSSGDRTAVLRAFGQTTDRDMLLSVMRMAETIPSSGDKSSLLKTLAPSYLDRDDDALRDAFFRTLSTVPSSGDMRSVLTGSVMGYAAANEKVAYAVARAAADVPSSGDRAAVLLGLADARALKSARVRDAYLKATEGMSGGDATRVLRAVAVDRY